MKKSERLKEAFSPEHLYQLEGALEFLRKFHPHLWEQMREQDIVTIIEVCHVLFVTSPSLLAATENPRYLPVQ